MGSVGQAIGGLVGGVVGFFIGGPQGAVWGFSIGMSVMAPAVKVPGAQIGDIAQQTSKEGEPRTIAWGTARPIGGNIVACSEPDIVRSTSTEGGKGGGGVETTTTTIYRTYAIGICEGPIDDVTRVWRNNKLVYDARVGSEWGATNNATWLTKATFYLGEYTQLPDANLEAIFGVGVVPAMRGTAYMVINREDLTDLGGAVPQYVFEVGNTSSFYQDAYADWRLYTVAWSGSVWYKLNALGSWLSLAKYPPNDFITYNEGKRGITITPFPQKNLYVCSSAIAGRGRIHVLPGADDVNNEWAECTVEDNPGNWWSIHSDTEGNVFAGSPGVGIWVKWVSADTFVKLPLTPPLGLLIGYINFNSIQVFEDTLYTCSTHASGRGVYSVNKEGGQLARLATFGTGNAEALWATPEGVVYVVVERAGGAYRDIYKSPSWGLVQSIYFPYSPGASSGCFALDGNCYISNTNGGIWIMEDGFDIINTAMAGPPYNPHFGVTTDLPQSGTGPATQIPWEYGNIVEDICERAGIPAEFYNTVDLEALDVYGFTMTNAYAAYTGIEALARVFFFDAANYDGVLNFIPRGGDEVLTIVNDDLVDDGAEIVKSSRRDSITVPRVMHLQYFDINGGLTPDKQSSDRSYDARSVAEVVTNSTVIMSADQAAAAVIVNHKVAIEEQRGEIGVKLSDSYLKLAPSNVIIYEGKHYRIGEVTTSDGYQSYKLLNDRQSAYGYSEVVGIPVQIPTEAPTLVIGDTVLHFIDSHILRDSDDKFGYYVVIAGSNLNWRGALVELSIDGGTNFIDSMTINKDCTMGTLTAALADHSHYYPDEINTTTVELLRGDMELNSTDLSGMQNRINLAMIGTELINFATVSELSSGEWELSYFLRGRKGSVAGSHAIGERFVLLERNNWLFVEADLFMLDQNLTFRVTSLGSSTPASQTVTLNGLSQTERQPAYLRCVRTGGNIIITWQGVGRLGGGVNIWMGVYFTGYRVTVNSTEEDTTNQTLTVADPGGNPTIKVQQINSITGLGTAIEMTL